MQQPRRLFPAWTLLLVPLVISAWTRGLWAPDEPRYAEVAREVFREPGFLVMRLCGEVYPDKPPLLFWLSGLMGRVTDWSPFGMRLISLLATLGTALLIARLARHWWSEREAQWAPAFFLGTAMVVEIGGRLQLDPLLTFLTTAALTLLVTGAGTKRATRWAGLCIGLGMLTKGPIALLVVALVLLSWKLLPGARQAEDSQQSKPRFDLVALALVLLPVLLWALLAILAEPELARPLLFDQHIGRVASKGSGTHWGPPQDTILGLMALFMPWTLPLFAGWIRGWNTARGRAGEADVGWARTWGWGLALLIFFSAIPPKRDLYLLPAYPAFALVTARWWCQVALSEAPSRGRKVALGLGPAVLCLVGVALSTVALLEGSIESLGKTVTDGLKDLPELADSLIWRLPLAASPLVVGSAVALIALARGRVLDCGRWTLGSFTLGSAAIFALFFPAIDQSKSAEAFAGVLAEQYANHKPKAVPVIGLKPEGLRFYSDVPTVARRLPSDLDGQMTGSESSMTEEELSPQAILEAWRLAEGSQMLAVVYDKLWQELEGDVQAQYQVLGEGRIGRRRAVIVTLR